MSGAKGEKVILLKKILFCLCLVRMSQIALGVGPEQVEFSRMETLKTWVRSDIFCSADIQKIQGHVFATVPQNPDSIKFIERVDDVSYEGKALESRELIGIEKAMFTKHRGHVFPTQAAIELPFLQRVHSVSLVKKAITLEMAAASGLVSWKVPYAFERNNGEHYANELSSKMLKNLDTTLNERISDPRLRDSIVIVPGSCFSILNQHPELRESVDAIYVQYLEHFFNPFEHALFLELLADLLAPGGCAYLCALSFSFGTDATHPLYKLYQEQKEKGEVIYRGFMQWDTTFQGTEPSYENSIISNVIHPADDTVVGLKDWIDQEETSIKLKDLYALSGGNFNPNLQGIAERFASKNAEMVVKLPLPKLRQRIVTNYFSPSIYRDAIEQHPRLAVVDSFFLDRNGMRKDKWGEGIVGAAVIVRKKDRSELASSGICGDKAKIEISQLLKKGVDENVTAFRVVSGLDLNKMLHEHTS